jgi:hypothetical protein
MMGPVQYRHGDDFAGGAFDRRGRDVGNAIIFLVAAGGKPDRRDSGVTCARP